MPIAGSPSQRFARVQAAFTADNFSVVPITDPRAPGATLAYLQTGQSIGVAAVHNGAFHSQHSRPKKAFYVEGNGFEKGWLIGRMAEPDVSRMAGDYIRDVAFDFFGPSPLGGPKALYRIKTLLVDIIEGAARKMLPDIPGEYIEEMKGIEAGCKEANPRTDVTLPRLMALNLGIDSVLAHVYTGEIFAEKRVHPSCLRTPIGCNAFSISGPAAAGRHFFGRDFMFPTADVFQDAACLVVYAPEDEAHRFFVSQTAPGFVGTMTGMNDAGVAVGVDMMPSGLCNPARPGFNSLLLLRDCIQHCPTAADAVDRIVQAPRGVSWAYPVADAAGGACIVEAGRRLEPGEPFPYLDKVPGYYRKHLPDLAYIERVRAAHGLPAPVQGLCARPRGYAYPREYLHDWNEGLWGAFGRNWLTRLGSAGGIAVTETGAFIRWIFTGRHRGWKRDVRKLHRHVDFHKAGFGERGYINHHRADRNCPGPFYFAPQRDIRDDVLVATNHCICPEMRLTAMTEWIALLAGGEQNDIQWRYDELNREILDALEAAPNGINEQEAWRLIDFLHPNGAFKSYYNKEGKKWEDVQVGGSVTLCELTSRTFTTRFGYYGDPPLTLHLLPFMP
ncbi:MAG: carcinine hydrolase/isopenicillin-N N-acyltransferase family protein [Spirochaetia bacterium]